MTKTTIETKMNKAFKMANLYTTAGQVEKAEMAMNEYNALVNELATARTTKEVEVLEVVSTVEEFTYYTVYGEINHEEKSIKLMGNALDFEVVEYSEETTVRLAPKFVKHIVNTEWDMKKSDEFIIKLTNKLVKMYKKIIAA